MCKIPKVERHFAWETMYLLGLILPAIREIFLKLHSCYCIGVIQAGSNFNCDRSIIKGTLRGKHYTLSIELRQPFEGFYRITITITHGARFTAGEVWLR
jgi:hypothetical protein